MTVMRYIVRDVDAAVAFYTRHLGLEVEDLEALVARLRAEGVPFRNEIVTGPGGRQILCEDPSGNVVELFEPAG